MGREPDDALGSDDRPRVGDRGVVLADVDAVGTGGDDKVGPVVEDEQRAVVGRGGGEPAPRGHDLLVGGVLHPQLDEVHAAGERAGEELVRPVVANQVEVRRSQAFVPICHEFEVWQER